MSASPISGPNSDIRTEYSPPASPRPVEMNQRITIVITEEMVREAEERSRRRNPLQLQGRTARTSDIVPQKG